MKKRYSCYLLVAFLFSTANLGEANAASCVLSETIANGQVADATKIMDNFDALADCAEKGVTTTGAPTSGSIAVMSGADTITSGDLTGDVTTSGGVAATLSTTGVTPGAYVNPSLIVDAKGRITSATSGSGGGGGGGSSLVNVFTVASAGNSFIDVLLDADNGKEYQVVISGKPSANASISFTISSNNGTSFYNTAGDYKDAVATNSASVNLVSSVGSGRSFLATFILAGMNNSSGQEFGLVGRSGGSTSTGNLINYDTMGRPNTLGTLDFNAFRISASAGNLNDVEVAVYRLR